MDKQLRQLESLLTDQLAAHDALLEVIGQKRQALRQADHQRLASLLGRENEQVQTIGQLERQRLELVAALTLRIEPNAAEPMRMLDLAGRLEEPARGRLLVLRQQLLDRMQQVQHESGVVRRATESLLRHVQGLVETVGTMWTGMGVYSAGGQRGAAHAQLSTFSTTA